MAENGRAARKSAAFLLDQVLGSHRMLSEVLAEGALNHLAPSDRARAQRLALSVLRNLSRVDAAIAPFASKAPPVTVQNLMRLGALELAEGAAAHGVVNDIVAIVAGHRRHFRLKGFANAVLRKVAADIPERWHDLPPQKLPKWLRKRLSMAWGQPVVAAIEAAHHLGAPLDLTARADPAQLLADLDATLLPTGSLRLVQTGQVSALAGYETGAWWVQDAAAALPAKLVHGERVLDLCAAPGGKTLQLAAAGRSVTAVDNSETRMARLRDNLTRTGLKAEIVTQDARKISGSWDAVLLDAPCSATGTIRRHPDLPFVKTGEDVASLVALQRELLDHALTCVAPGGQLVFCTCSLLPQEGEDHIRTLLETRKDLRIDATAYDQPWIEAGWRSPEGGLRLRPDFWPDIGGMDGFYICALRKDA